MFKITKRTYLMQAADMKLLSVKIKIMQYNLLTVKSPNEIILYFSRSKVKYNEYNDCEIVVFRNALTIYCRHHNTLYSQIGAVTNKEQLIRKG